MEITVKTLFGFESILQDELQELGYSDTKTLNRAVQLNGNWEDVYRLNYRCRLAIAVLVKIKSFTIHKEDDLYKEAKKIDWTNYFEVDKTFAVKGAIFSTLFKHTQYPMLVIKDAIADVFRDKVGERPNVNIKAPQVMFDLYVKDKKATISINTSGLPLFQRGYRQETGEAPMNEVLASGILRLSGWDRKSTLIDPMCGSGTIAIEAALWAAGIPAMIERSHYAFKNFKSFDPHSWDKVQKEGNHRPIDLGFPIYASDIDAGMVNIAKRNSKMAPIGNMIQFERADFLKLKAQDDKGTIICNPPYGDRMGEDIDLLYQNMGNTFKNNFVGYDCWVVSSNLTALKLLGLHPDKKIKVFNGSLECSLRKFSVFEGAKDEHKRQNNANDTSARKEEKSEVINQKSNVNTTQARKAFLEENLDKKDHSKVAKYADKSKAIAKNRKTISDKVDHSKTSSKIISSKYGKVEKSSNKYGIDKPISAADNKISKKYGQPKSLKEKIDQIKNKRK